jgi:hypothetical protein
MPPHRGTAWARGSLLSDRIPPPASPQPTKSEKGKGKGKAKAATPEPPPRSAAVRRLDELLSGLASSSTSNQPPKNEIKRAATAPGAASADREGCFCQGMSKCRLCLPSWLSVLPSSTLLIFPIHRVCIQFMTYHISPSARTIRIHAHLPILRPRPLRPTPPTPPLSVLRHAAPCAACARGAHRAAGGDEGGDA